MRNQLKYPRHHSTVFFYSMTIQYCAGVLCPRSLHFLLGNNTKIFRSRNASANQGKVSRADGKKPHKNKHNRKNAKSNRDYENEEWRTVYIGFVERGTSEEELVHHFKVPQRGLLLFGL